jgi:hypothetical protein
MTTPHLQHSRIRLFLLAGLTVLVGACASQHNESALTKAGGQPLPREELERMFANPVTLTWEAADGCTVGATEATPDGSVRDFDITSSARVGFDHRSLRHAPPARAGKYVIVNDNRCIRSPERRRPVRVRFFKTGANRYTALLANGQRS